MVTPHTFQKDYRPITYEMDDLRTKVETVRLRAINGVTIQSPVGSASADAQDTSRRSDSPIIL